MSAAAEKSIPAAEIQRQFTRYLRDPENAPLPPGADALRMRIYAKQFRAKLFRTVERRIAGLVCS